MDSCDERTRIRAAAEAAFADHAIEQRRPGVWRCAKPGTWHMGFHVAELPGAIAIWGDIGSMLVDPAGAGYDVEWLRGSIRSMDYVLSKATRVHQTRFEPVRFEAHLRELVAEPVATPPRPCRCGEKGGIAACAAWLIAQTDFEEEFFRPYVEECHHGDSEIYHSMNDWEVDDLWSFEALRCFVRLLPVPLTLVAQGAPA